jgi:replicative DNA helicase
MAQAINSPLTAEMFYNPANRVVYSRLVRMLSESKKIEPASLITEMQGTKELEEVGGMAYIVQISSRIGTSAQLDYFAEKIRTAYQLREVIRHASMLVENCYNYTGEGVDTLLSRPVSQLIELSSGSAAAPEPSWSAVVDRAGDALQNIFTNAGLPADTIIEFPWQQMNDYFGPMQRGQLVVLAARTSVGKSSLARPITVHAGENGHKIYFVTLEVNPEQVALQMAAMSGRIGLRQIAKAHPNDQQEMKQTLLNLRWLGITISRRDKTIARILGKARALKTAKGLDLLVIDHGLLVEDILNASKEEKTAVIGKFTKVLKHLAGELNIAVLLLWQLNRGGERDGGREPLLIDLKDCGSLEEDADKVILLHRPSEDPWTQQQQPTTSPFDEVPKFWMKLIQAKGRDDGTAHIPFYFTRQTASFHPAAKPSSHPPAQRQQVK